MSRPTVSEKTNYERRTVKGIYQLTLYQTYNQSTKWEGSWGGKPYFSLRQSSLETIGKWETYENTLDVNLIEGGIRRNSHVSLPEESHATAEVNPKERNVNDTETEWNEKWRAEASICPL